MILYLGMRAISFLVSRLPLTVSYAVAVFLAVLVFPLLPNKRRNALDNMAQVLGAGPDSVQVQKTVDAAVRNYARYLVDFLLIPHTTQCDLDRRIHVPTWSFIDDALAEGRGAIFVGMHMGSWDLGAACLAQRGYPVHAIVDIFKHPHLNRFIQTTRSQTGLGIIPVHQAYRHIVRVLRRGEILGVLIDRPMPSDGIPVEFFGKTTSVPAGAAALSLRTGAPIVAMAILRQPDHTFLGLVSPVFSLEPSGDDRGDVQALTQRIMLEFEHLIRRYPDQWYMFRPMWPDDASSAVSWDAVATRAEATK